MGKISKGSVLNKYHHIENIKINKETLQLTIDGKEFNFELSKVSEKLARASQIERKKFEISPSGYGIHWPLLDEDLSIDGLLGIVHKPPKYKKKILISSSDKE